MKYWYCIFFVFCSGKNFAQTAKEDSIPTVEVIGYREQSYIAIPNTFSPNSLQMRFFGRTDISDLLQRTAPVIINNYGSGSASISIRGTNDDHTQVLWNGIPLNSITLGSMDISLLQVESASTITVVTNAGSNLFGSGTFGGVILLDDDVRWPSQVHADLRTDIGSFNVYRTQLGVQAGNDRVQWRSQSFYQHALNDFSYTDVFRPGQPRDTMEHNGMQQSGGINTVRWKISNNDILHVGNWTQWKAKDIPGIMGSYQLSSKFQEDLASRSFVKYNHLFRHAQLQFSSAHVHDRLRYSDKLSPADTFLFINSDFTTNSLLNTISYTHYVNGSLQLDAATDINYLLADVSAYGGQVGQYQGAVFAGMIFAHKMMLLSATIRQEIQPGQYIRPMIGINLDLVPKKKIYGIGFSYADKFHAPDLNDQYWTPGGNPDLLAEQGFTAEISQHFRLLRKVANELTLRVNTYATRIRDEIIWRPVSGLVWTPENVQTVLHYGIESSMQYNRIIRNGQCDLNLIYMFNRSEIRKNDIDNSIIGRLIVYRPQHAVKAAFLYRQGVFNGGINYFFTGKRYTDNENFDAFALKAYGLLDLFAGFSLPFRNTFDLDVLVRVSNVLDVSYQSVRSYAQPGRGVTLSVIIQFNKIKSHEI